MAVSEREVAALEKDVQRLVKFGIDAEKEAALLSLFQGLPQITP